MTEIATLSDAELGDLYLRATRDLENRKVSSYSTIMFSAGDVLALAATSPEPREGKQ